jgi:hypothetical protein
MVAIVKFKILQAVVEKSIKSAAEYDPTPPTCT